MKQQPQTSADRLLNQTQPEATTGGVKPAEIQDVHDHGENTVTAKVTLESPEQAYATYRHYRDTFLALTGKKLSARQMTRVLQAYICMPFSEPKLNDPIEALLLNSLIMASDSKYQFIDMSKKKSAEKLNNMTVEEKIENFNKIREEVKENG
jgi:hypothetical protein